MSIAIALDGPAGAGKSSIAKRVAKALDCIYVDTGALYRTIGLSATRNSVAPEDENAVKNLLSKITVDLTFNEKGEQIVLLDNEDVSRLIRTPEASMMASKISAVPIVRAYLLDLQRNMAKTHDVIMDGRDIGTTILPNAEVKIYLTASADTRAKRRALEYEQKGEAFDLDQIRKDIIERDERDMNREISPLKQADDAVLVDSSEMGIDDVVSAILDVYKEKVQKK